MPDIDHFSDSEASFHSFSDDEPSPPPADASSTQHSTQGQDHDRQSRRRNRSPKPQVPETTSAESTTGAAAKIERFSPEEEATLLAESNSLKGSANQLFGKGSFENAIQTYDRALSSCPNYLDFEVAVLRSNVAACHLKLEEWKEAVESATKGVECLERLEPLPVLKPAKTGREKARGGGDDEAEEEGRDDLIEEVDDAVADRIENLQKSGKTLDEVRKLHIKLLLRRARAKSSLNTWAELQGADEDYRVLMSPAMIPSLSPTDRKQVLESARKLAPRLNEAKDREMAEMMGKLKGVGNSVLGMFGLSTDNFQFVKDEKSGGYSMNFNQNPGK